MDRRIGVDIKNDARFRDLTSKEWIACGRLAEECGFESVWLNEDIAHDSLMLLAVLAGETSRVKLGTAIVNVYNRSAFQMAMGIATLDELSNGRAGLGLSVGHHPWNDLAHGIPMDKPVARAREYAEFIRKAVTCNPFTHEGNLFKGVSSSLAIDRPEGELPIYIGGERGQMIKAAAEVADGLIINLATGWYMKNFVRPHFDACARSVRRDPSKLEILGIMTCCVSDDEHEALEQARETFMGRLGNNPTKLMDTMPPELHSELRYLDGLVKVGEMDRAQREASPEIVRTLVPAGTPEQVFRRLEDFFDCGATRVCVAPYPRDKAHVERVLTALSPYLSKDLLKAQA